MNAERYRRLKEVFAAACSCEPDERPAVLERECAGDPELRREVELLLEHDARPAVDIEREAERLLERSAPAQLEAIGDYRILGTLGQGGMGVVYLAQQERPRRLVALKVLRSAHVDDRELRRFDRETHALGLLAHPGIAQVYDAGTHETSHGPEPYFVMEIVDGVPITDYAAARSSGTRARLTLIAEICDAVEYAHTQGVVHRDLKPANILVTAAGVPKILDFGIARMTRGGTDAQTLHTETGEIIGTVPYMSPEQISGRREHIDGRTDVYAIGVLLYELLASRLPHALQDRTLPEAARIITDDEPVELASINRTYRGDISTIASRALEKDPARRYQSAAALAADIRRHLASEPILARRPSTAYQLRKFAARNRALVGGVVTVILVSLIGAVVATTLAITASRQRGLATERADDLQHLTELQSSMLSEFDAEVAGQSLTTTLRTTIRRRLAEQGLGEDEITAAMMRFDEAMRGVNATDLAVSVIDEQVLQRTARSLETDFIDRPLVRAALAQTVADSYRALGRFEQALPIQESALELRRNELGESHTDTVTSVFREGLLLWDMGRYAEAEERFRASHVARRELLGERHPETLEAWAHHASLLRATDQLDEAERAYRGVLTAQREVLGADHPDSLRTQQNLALHLSRTDRLDEAEQMFRDALEAQERVEGPDDIGTIAVVMNLAAVLDLAERFDQSAVLYDRALVAYSAQLGDDHSRTTTVLGNYAILRLRMGDMEGAAEMLERALAARRRTLGDDHPSTATTCSNLGGVMARLERWSEAEQLYRDAVRSSILALGEAHRSTINRMNNLASLLRDRDQLAESLELGARVIELAEAELTETEWRRGLYMASYGRTLARLNRFEEASSHLIRGYDIYEATLGTDNRRTIALIETIAEFYDAWDEAEPGAGHDDAATAWRDRSAASPP